MGQDARAARTATTASSSPALRDTATGPAIHDEPVRALPGSSLGENVGLHSAVSTSLLLKIELCLAFVLFLAVVAALTWEVGSRPL